MFQRHFFASCVALGISATGLWAEDRPTDAILDLLSLPQTIEVMRKEGLSYGAELGADMLMSGPNSGWSATVERIYDTERMEETVRAGVAAAWEEGQGDLETLTAFFADDAGQRVVQLEISARDAMSETGIEEAARLAWRVEADKPEDEQDPRLELIAEFVESNDLIEANVVGAMNSSYAFYLGLVEGGAFEMTEEDILREVWSTEAENREDTREWLFGYMMMSYRPLEVEALAAYVDMAKSEDGRALNRALFAGFDRMYSDISYALGLALAQQMTAQDL
ncbi:DUF2059 domain-containing protein [Primorskyibacter aestuariivivens]|uniref:DUF2059 domain-containing protein n=1 Tax=Primorskyibacter aestuariivivens TaxID=1888912 RepID=UPI002300BDAF|nr:DUF2059 domain-containing protein [Primorskyibacter aestuariivivens]MDA7429802.1 DUF2059 domain-containing protein [Primorskyibacter aestuariivivens]